MKNIKNKKIYRVLMTNYFKAFILSFILGILIIIVLVYAMSYANSNEQDSNYAEKFMKDDYKDIDSEYIKNNLGTMMIVNDDLEILKSAGEEPEEFMDSIIGNNSDEDKVIIENNKIDKRDWNMFLYRFSQYKHSNICSIAYNKSKKFYLIVKIPVAVTLTFSIDINTNREILPESISILAFIIFIYGLVLFIGMYGYSKITARVFVKPLTKLCNGVKKLEAGDYKEHIKISGKGSNEFQSLAESFNNLCDTLDNEKKMRKETEDNKKRLILDISHDLKNPLTGVMGSLEMCMNMYDLNKDYNANATEIKDKMHHYLSMAYKNSIRANSLIESLFEYSKLESPDYTVKLEKIDFCEFLRLCILSEIDDLEEAGLIGEYDIPDEPIYAHIDQKEFSRVLHNLISNAIKYNKKGTEIKISLFKEDDKIVLTVEDNGIGMDKSLSEEIFSVFKRNENMISSKDLKNSSSENELIQKNDGTGLGLAIVKKIVNMHNGEIYLKTDINKGCIFTIVLF